VLDPSERLEYRVKFFLTWSVSGLALLLGLMTVFLACGSVCGEVKHKRIFTTMTKPVGPARYIAGKWLGVSLLNLVLVVVGGIGIHAFAHFLKGKQAQGPLDRSAVDHEVLVAREAVNPRPPEDLNIGRLYQQRLEQLRRQEPERYRVLSEKQEREIRQRVLAKNWHSIPPQGGRTYVFKNLDPLRKKVDRFRAAREDEPSAAAAAEAPRLQLRIKPNASGNPPGGKVRLGFRLNGRPWPLRRGEDGNPRRVASELSEGDPHVLRIPAQAVNEQGRLALTVENVDPRGPRGSSVTVTPGEGLQLLYRVGRFGPNLTRGLALIWMQLSLIAMLGIAAGTFLGFPVASLVCLTVYFTATSAGFVSEAVNRYAHFDIEGLSAFQTLLWFPKQLGAHVAEGAPWEAAKIVIRLFGSAFLHMVPSFESFDSTPRVAHGKVVPFSMLRDGVLWMLGLWTGGFALLAFLIFRRRELAEVTV
jgi:ABC-type transport system involved in multi-copper enzyme maturation permease subunit